MFDSVQVDWTLKSELTWYEQPLPTATEVTNEGKVPRIAAMGTRRLLRNILIEVYKKTVSVI